MRQLMCSFSSRCNGRSRNSTGRRSGQRGQNTTADGGYLLSIELLLLVCLGVWVHARNGTGSGHIFLHGLWGLTLIWCRKPKGYRMNQNILKKSVDGNIAAILIVLAYQRALLIVKELLPTLSASVVAILLYSRIANTGVSPL